VGHSKTHQDKRGRGFAIIVSTGLSILILFVFSLKILIATVCLNASWFFIEKRRFERQKSRDSSIEIL